MKIQYDDNVLIKLRRQYNKDETVLWAINTITELSKKNNELSLDNRLLKNRNLELEKDLSTLVSGDGKISASLKIKLNKLNDVKFTAKERLAIRTDARVEQLSTKVKTLESEVGKKRKTISELAHQLVMANKNSNV